MTVNFDFRYASLEDNETACCPESNCEYNNRPIREHLYVAVLGEQITNVYCPYCRAGLVITKKDKNH